MPLPKEMIFHVLATVYGISTVAFLLEGMRIDYYKLLFTKCVLKDLNIWNSSTSITTCASLCTQNSACTGFAMRRGDCGLLETGPPCCTPLMMSDHGWSVYYPDGNLKTYYTTPL